MSRSGRGDLWGDRVGRHLSMPTPTRESLSDVSAFRVRLKFHDDLTFFLKSKTRNGIIDRNLVEKTSVKDVIESCGIPHPEVDLILVNNKPVDFSHPIVKDADIDVYPVQSRYLLFTETRLQVRSINRFVADGHLGALARNLRLLGLDVVYDRQAQDRQLLSVMEREDRALLTRDRHLLMHAIVRHCARARKTQTTKRWVVVAYPFRFNLSVQPLPSLHGPPKKLQLT
jgi:hypothetical protein